MASLYLARRSGAAGFSRRAAIKVIHPHLLQDPRFVRMFIDEARISSRISHPNVVHVEEFGEQSGWFYLVMEYVEGCSAGDLQQAVRASGSLLPLDIAAHIALRIAEGLHSAHETCDEDGAPLHVVHRDVSPANVLLSREGHIKLIDFGIAKARGRLAETNCSSLKGKVRYMSPEQARGEPVDRRSDIYSCGVLLWELLCGRHAFDGSDTLGLLAQVRDPHLRSVGELRPEVPLALAQVVAAATAKSPEHRPQTAYDLSRMIAHAHPGALGLDPRQFSNIIHRVFALGQYERAPAMRELPPTTVNNSNSVPLRSPALPPHSTGPLPRPNPLSPPQQPRARGLASRTFGLLAAGAVVAGAAVGIAFWVASAANEKAAPAAAATLDRAPAPDVVREPPPPAPIAAAAPTDGEAEKRARVEALRREALDLLRRDEYEKATARVVEALTISEAQEELGSLLDQIEAQQRDRLSAAPVAKAPVKAERVARRDSESPTPRSVEALRAAPEFEAAATPPALPVAAAVARGETSSTRPSRRLRRSSPRAPLPADLGRVCVFTDNRAQTVLINGRAFGSAPVDVDLTPGPVHVELRQGGRTVERRTVHATGGKIRRVSFKKGKKRKPGR